eukprot:gene471-7863_t
MAGTRISDNLPPLLDVTKASVAYGDRALPKLHRELKGNDLLVIQQALRSLSDIIRNPTHLQSAIDEGIQTACRHLLRHDDLVVRQLSLQLVSHVANHAVGRNALLSADYIPALTERFLDQEPTVRWYAHRVINQLSTMPQGAIRILEADLSSTLVDHLVKEDDIDTKVEILTALHNCLKCNADPLLATNIMTVVVGLLSHSHDALREAASVVLTGLSFPLEGKRQGVASGAVKAALQLHDDSNSRIRAQCAAATMSLAITTEGKHAAVADGATQILPSLLDDESDSVVLAAVKAITTLTEHPEARSSFLPLLKKLQAVKEKYIGHIQGDAICRAVDKAIETIQWCP